MNAYIVLAASTLIQICLGGLFAWSVFVPPLRSTYHFTTAQATSVFGITVAAFALSMPIAGRLQAKFGPRLIACIGGLLFGLGYLIASHSHGSLTQIILGIGIISGIGIGFGYVCPLATCVKWFPKYKGLVTGVSVAGFGGGAILLSALATSLSKEMGVLQVFRVVGLAYGSTVFISALFLSVPRDCAEQASKDIPIRELFGQKSFWRLAVGMFCGTFAGLLVVGNIKTMGLSSGISAATATASIGVFAVGNALGRITWGHLSDRYGKPVVLWSLLFLCAVVLALRAATGLSVTFLIAAAAVGFGFGSNFVVYAAQVATSFGIDAVGTVYPFVFVFYGLSGITGPVVGGWLFDRTGNYTASILVAAALAAIGAISTTLLSPRSRKLTTAQG